MQAQRKKQLQKMQKNRRRQSGQQLRSSQKRTTSDFTHNVYLLYLFACAAYRYRTGKLCFVCKARTVSLYTREVYHTFHGKTTHFCPKTAFIIDCIKYIDRLF